MEDARLSQIKEETLAGHMIEAIKLYREYYHVGLAEAKSAVEHLLVDLKEDRIKNIPLAQYQPEGHRPLSGARQAGIHAALFGGNKKEAVKLYREINPVSLVEAKTVIDAIEAELRAQTPGLFAKPPMALSTSIFYFFVILVAIVIGIWRMMH